MMLYSSRSKATLAQYVVQLSKPDLSGSRLDDEASSIFLRVTHISVHHRVRYLQQDFITQVFSTGDAIQFSMHGKENMGKRYQEDLTQL